MHAQVRASHLDTLVVGTPWENFLETTFLPGMGVGYLGKIWENKLEHSGYL